MVGPDVDRVDNVVVSRVGVVSVSADESNVSVRIGEFVPETSEFIVIVSTGTIASVDVAETEGGKLAGVSASGVLESGVSGSGVSAPSVLQGTDTVITAVPTVEIWEHHSTVIVDSTEPAPAIVASWTMLSYLSLRSTLLNVDDTAPTMELTSAEFPEPIMLESASANCDMGASVGRVRPESWPARLVGSVIPRVLDGS